MNLYNEISKLEQEREVLISYLMRKAESREDWHAVADAAMDLRELEAKLYALKLWKDTESLIS